MANLVRAALALVLAFATAQARTSVLRIAVAGHLGDPTTQAIEALDTDRSGKVEKSEVEAFARSQGLSPEQVRAEFRSLDLNGDGELEANEISNTLAAVDAAPAPKAVEVPSAPPAVAASFPVATSALVPEVAPRAAPLAVAAPVAAAPVPQGAAKGPLSRQALELEAQQHAGKALAEVFARTAAKALDSRTEDQEKATELEATAKSLRGQTAELRRTATAQTMKAAQEAVMAVLREAEGSVRVMDQQATKAEEQAAARRAEAKEAMEKAMAAQRGMAAAGLSNRDPL